MNTIEIALIIIALLFFVFAVVSIRRVRILDRELKEARQELSKQSTKLAMKS
jgi:uncharacterized protein YoxC